jgi:N-methylhydantoinase A
VEYVIGIDTGGTFTDVVVIDGQGEVVSTKASTTPHDLSEGLMAALGQAAEALGHDLDAFLTATRVLRFSGTTATNALLVRAGETAGMLTTAGFEDTLHIARAVSAWAGMSEQQLRRVFHQHKPEPLIERALIHGVTERIDSDGVVVVRLDAQDVRRGVRALLDGGAKSIAICFMWSVRNAEHELEAARIVRELAPGVPVHCSHAVAPSVGEYERFVTTAVDAYVSPVLSRFLDSFQAQLAAHGFGGQLLIAQADGGCLYPQDARPVSTLHSGPAAGVIASSFEGAKIGRRSIVTTDVGGTSFDVGLVADGEWTYAREPELGRFHLSVPMIEVASVGAGGGSVAWVDEVGVLHVGPKSAGAMPGPACYGRGGTEPTVTDADLLLGYLDPDSKLGGRVALSRKLAEQAVAPLADRLGLDIVETAAGIFQIANSHMGDLLTRQIVARGHDPRDFVIFAYGGAGPMHCAFYAAECGIGEVIVPSRAGTFSALGVATAPLLHSARSATFVPMPMDAARFTQELRELDAKVVGALDRDRVPDEHREVTYLLEMRYGAQVHTVRIAIPRLDSYDDRALVDACALFDATYDRLYGAGSGYPDAGRFLTTFIVEGRGNLPVPTAPTAATKTAGTGAEHALVGERDAYFDAGFVPTRVYRYEQLEPGDRVEGPCIVEAEQSTAVIPPGATAAVDEQHNLRIGELTVHGEDRGALAAVAIGSES